MVYLRHMSISVPSQIPECLMSYVIFFCVQWVQLRWELIVCFVDIGGIGDHHCLIFFSSRSGWQLWHIHISNDNGSFPFLLGYFLSSITDKTFIYRICMGKTGVFSRKSKRSYLDPLISRSLYRWCPFTKETLRQKRWFKFSHCELSIYM